MKWLMDLIWPKAPVTMEEVGKSRADVPVENLKAPAWKPDMPVIPDAGGIVNVVNVPRSPEVDSLARQVVALREEVARVKQEAMGAILEARHETARYHADERGERDALSRRLDRVEASFPVGWSTSAWYTKKAGDVWLNVSDRRTGWYVSVTSAREDQSGCLESGPHETMAVAIESAERLGKQLSVEMEDRTVIAGCVVKQTCFEVGKV